MFGRKKCLIEIGCVSYAQNIAVLKEDSSRSPCSKPSPNLSLRRPILGLNSTSSAPGSGSRSRRGCPRRPILGLDSTSLTPGSGSRSCRGCPRRPSLGLDSTSSGRSSTPCPTPSAHCWLGSWTPWRQHIDSASFCDDEFNDVNDIFGFIFFASLLVTFELTSFKLTRFLTSVIFDEFWLTSFSRDFLTFKQKQKNFWELSCCDFTNFFFTEFRRVSQSVKIEYTQYTYLLRLCWFRNYFFPLITLISSWIQWRKKKQFDVIRSLRIIWSLRGILNFCNFFSQLSTSAPNFHAWLTRPFWKNLNFDFRSLVQT